MATEEPKTKRQRVMLLGAVAVLVIAAVLMARYVAGSKAPGALNAERVFKCVECGHEFEHELKMGEKDPVPCPKCGKQAGWMAEKCYWTHDAAGNWKAKVNPTYVVLKSRIDPSSTEKTTCPDCGHAVVGHNPKPPRELMEAAEKEANK